MGAGFGGGFFSSGSSRGVAGHRGHALHVGFTSVLRRNPEQGQLLPEQRWQCCVAGLMEALHVPAEQPQLGCLRQDRHRDRAGRARARGSPEPGPSPRPQQQPRQVSPGPANPQPAGPGGQALRAQGAQATQRRPSNQHRCFSTPPTLSPCLLHERVQPQERTHRAHRAHRSRWGPLRPKGRQSNRNQLGGLVALGLVAEAQSLGLAGGMSSAGSPAWSRWPRESARRPRARPQPWTQTAATTQTSIARTSQPATSRPGRPSAEGRRHQEQAAQGQATPRRPSNQQWCFSTPPTSPHQPALPAAGAPAHTLSPSWLPPTFSSHLPIMAPTYLPYSGSHSPRGMPCTSVAYSPRSACSWSGWGG